MNRVADTETHCHCGAEYRGSDHCPDCGCEQYETQIVKRCPYETAVKVAVETGRWTAVDYLTGVNA